VQKFRFLVFLGAGFQISGAGFEILGLFGSASSMMMPSATADVGAVHFPPGAGLRISRLEFRVPCNAGPFLYFGLRISGFGFDLF